MRTLVSGIWYLIFAAILAGCVGGCMAPVSLQEGQAWSERTWQGHLGNDQRIEQAWETVFRAARQADIDYSTQKAIDLVKVAAKTPADIEEAIKAVVAEREKAMGDTEIVIARMRSLVLVNQNEAAKALKIQGAISQWMVTGMEINAVPNLINEAFSVMKGLGLQVALPGVETAPIQPEKVSGIPAPAVADK